MDLASDLGTGLGATSLGLCVMSHAGCYATICALMAKRMRLVLKALKVKGETLKTEDAGILLRKPLRYYTKTDA